MQRKIARILALTAVSATAMLTLTGCGAGTGNNSAPGNDQSTPAKVAESYFQDITHFDTTKLSAILTNPLIKKQQASMSQSVDQYAGKSPYADFHLASVKKEYADGGYDHEATVYFTYKFNDKTVKSHIGVVVDPEVDDTVWMIDTGSNTYGVELGGNYPVNVASNTLTINGKTSKVDRNTRVFPSVPYAQKITFRNNLATPVKIRDCGDFVADAICKGEGTTGGDVDTAQVKATVLAAIAKQVPSKNGNHAPSIEGDEIRSTGSFVGDDGSDLTSAGKSIYDTYAAAGNYYKAGTAPTVKVTDLSVDIYGGTYQAYDFVTTYEDNGCRPGSETALGCNDPIRTYAYKAAWNTYPYDGWTVSLNKSGEVDQIVPEIHDESDILS